MLTNASYRSDFCCNFIHASLSHFVPADSVLRGCGKFTLNACDLKVEKVLKFNHVLEFSAQKLPSDFFFVVFPQFIQTNQRIVH